VYLVICILLLLLLCICNIIVVMANLGSWTVFVLASLLPLVRCDGFAEGDKTAQQQTTIKKSKLAKPDPKVCNISYVYLILYFPL